MEGSKSIAASYYEAIGRRAVIERHGIEIRREAKKVYNKKLEDIAKSNGIDIVKLYAETTANIIDNLLITGVIKLKN